MLSGGFCRYDDRGSSGHDPWRFVAWFGRFGTVSGAHFPRFGWTYPMPSVVKKYELATFFEWNRFLEEADEWSGAGIRTHKSVEFYRKNGGNGSGSAATPPDTRTPQTRERQPVP